jgi:homoserine dehydrogenase
MSIQKQKLTIGLYGFGVVGESLYTVLADTPTLNATIKKVCIKHPEKRRNAPVELFTTDPRDILNDPEINIVVELIDDAQAAYNIVAAALCSGKAVVTANKKMIAEHLEELITLQKEYDVPLLYEAACCASIPVIRNLEEYYDNDLLHSVSGIVNGSTNYILTKVFAEQKSFDIALKEAQQAGFAESDPSLDVNGIDAVNKLSILLTHAYGIITQPAELLHSGIQHLHEHDAVFAAEKGYAIKLVAHAQKLADGSVAAFVLPQFVQKDNQLYEVSNEYNGVVIESSLADKQFFSGKGAGGFPTSSAVLSDLSALRYNYRYEYKKLNRTNALQLSDDFYLEVCVSAKSLKDIPQEHFEEVSEWISNSKRCSVTGVIHYSELLRKSWWKRTGVSLVVCPQGVISAKEYKGRSATKERADVEIFA